MVLKINLTRKIDAKVLLFNHQDQYKRYIPLQFGLNEVEIDLNEIKFIRFKCERKNTDNLILADNIELLTIRYNIKKKAYNITLEKENKMAGRFKNVYFTDEDNLSYRKRPDKKVTFYFSPNFKNQDVHLIIAFDSQNIYDIKHIGNYTTKNDPYGGWQMDVPIDLSGKNFIVAGIEDADKYRTEELTPDFKNQRYNRAKLPNGKLDQLANFIHTKVLDYLKQYKITDCTVCGASMGGLAAHYLGIKFPEIYDYIMSFSSASGLLSDGFWKDLYAKSNINKNQKYGIFQGEADPLEKELGKGNKNMISNLIRAGIPKENIIYLFDKDLKHNEISWRYAFNYLFNEFFNK